MSKAKKTVAKKSAAKKKTIKKKVIKNDSDKGANDAHTRAQDESPFFWNEHGNPCKKK